MAACGRPFLLHGFLQLLEEGELLVDVGFLLILLEAVFQVLEGGLCLGNSSLDILAAGRCGCGFLRVVVFLVAMWFPPS